MGVDFNRRAAPNFRKSWNHGKYELAIPTLFTRAPDTQTRSLVAECSAISQMNAGSAITVVAEGDSLLTLNGTRPVGKVKSVPFDIMKRIQDAGGIAVATVRDIHPLSETFDVELP
jgi:hypothetical protein